MKQGVNVETKAKTMMWTSEDARRQALKSANICGPYWTNNKLAHQNINAQAHCECVRERETVFLALPWFHNMVSQHVKVSVSSFCTMLNLQKGWTNLFGGGEVHWHVCVRMHFLDKLRVTFMLNMFPNFSCQIANDHCFQHIVVDKNSGTAVGFCGGISFCSTLFEITTIKIKNNQIIKL